MAGALLALWMVGRAVGSAARGLAPRPAQTTVTHSLVVERVRSVAKLLTSETTVRDVVVYRNRWLGSTKRSLVVVTGRVLAGVDLDRGTEVRVDPEARRVAITLPHADVIGIEITDLRTYDERNGIWNPFRPADRDSIYQLAREQIVASALELGTVRHAEESARQVLEALIGTEGYQVEVSFADRPARPDSAGVTERT